MTVVRVPPQLPVIQPVRTRALYGRPPGITVPPAPVRDPPFSPVLEWAPGADITKDPGSFAWVDVSVDVLDNDTYQGVQVISTGLPDEATQFQATQVQFALNNATDTGGRVGGRWTPRLASSPNYPYVRQNAPFRISMNAGSGNAVRVIVYAASWQPTWDANLSRPVVVVQAWGALRRETQGRQPLPSPLFGAIPKTAPIAYWSLEDGPNATQAVSFVSGVAPLVPVGVNAIRFGSASGAPGSAPVADFSSGGSLAALLPPSSATSWRVEFIAKFNQFAASFAAVLQIFTTGGIALWEFDATEVADGGLYVQYITSNGALGGPFLSNTRVDDEFWHHIRMDASKSGGNINITVSLDGIVVITQTVVAVAFGTITRVLINPTFDATEEVPAMGHLTVWEPWAGTIDTVTVAKGYAGETADVRLARLCSEQSIPITVIGSGGVAMGPQPVDTFASQLTDCVKADFGLLSDTAGSLTYRSHVARYNLPAALTIDNAAGQFYRPFGPIEDDQLRGNYWIVSRPGGSSATWSDTTSSEGSGAVGLYDQADTANVATDLLLLQQAGWRVNLGTVAQMRYAAVALNLIGSPGLIVPWCALRVGDRITLRHPPAEHPQEDIDLIVIGWAESLRKYSWDVAMVCVPIAPWRVAVIADLTHPWRVNTDGASLHADIGTGDTSFTVDCTGALFTTTATFPADFPVDIDMDGEQMTVTAIVGASSPQTFTVTRSVNGIVKTHKAGAPVNFWRLATIAF